MAQGHERMTRRMPGGGQGEGRLVLPPASSSPDLSKEPSLGKNDAGMGRMLTREAREDHRKDKLVFLHTRHECIIIFYCQLWLVSWLHSRSLFRWIKRPSKPCP
mmetsp:Transcript_14607/g.41713  ORF Transcript_14607/g.41713 Transcript_14607/m.41713 type:complete len:104 (+) Transcript_14607:1921-2232(+)